MISSLYIAKLAIEAVAGTPIAYAVVAYLRRKLVLEYRNIDENSLYHQIAFFACDRYLCLNA